MGIVKLDKKEVESRLNNAYAYIENKVLAWNDNELSDITWKFTLGDVILNVIKSMNIDIAKGSSINMESKDDSWEIVIGEAVINIKTTKSLGEPENS